MLDLIGLQACRHEVTINKGAAGLRNLQVVRVELQAVVDQVLHLLSHNLHGGVALAAVDPLDAAVSADSFWPKIAAKPSSLIWLAI